ncbi:MAG: Ig-like domain-containing protein [Candidatus Thermoplasmatota archaeon]|nr:Ig-like domain-containing protein [Candidatus Thermoplasmatota archaeon]
MSRKIAAWSLVLVLLMSGVLIAIGQEPTTQRQREYEITGIVLHSLDGNARIYNETKVWVCENITVYLLKNVTNINIDTGATDQGTNETDRDSFSFIPESQPNWAEGDEGIAVGEFHSELNYAFITNFTLKTIYYPPPVDKTEYVGICDATEWELIPTPRIYKRGDTWINISIPKFTNQQISALGGGTPNSNNTIGYAIWRDDLLDKRAGIADYSNETHYFFNDTTISLGGSYYYSVSPIARANYEVSARSLKLSTDELDISIAQELETACFTGGSVLKLAYNITGGAAPFKIIFNLTELNIVYETTNYRHGEHTYDLVIPTVNATHVKLNITLTDDTGRTDWLITPSVGYFGIDSKKPTVSNVTPESGASDVSIYGDILIEFDEQMNETSVENAFSISPAVSNLAWSWVTEWVTDDRKISKAIISHDPFQANETYSCSLTAEAKDLSKPGNSLVPYSWSFKTTPLISLSLHFPYPAARLTGNVTQTLRYSVGGGLAPYNITILFYNGTAWSYAANLTNIQSGANSYSWSAPALDISNAKLKFNAIDARGLTALLEREFVLDSTAPKLLEYTGSEGTAATTGKILLAFSEAMNITSVEQNFNLIDNETNTNVDGTWKWEDSKIAIFEPAAALGPNKNYTARITSEALDISIPGNRLVEKVWYFTALEGRGDFIVTVTFPTMPRKGDVGKITVSLFNTGIRGFNSSGTIIIKFYQSPDGVAWAPIDTKIIPGMWFGSSETRSIDVKFETAGDYYFRVEIDSTSASDIFNDRDSFVTIAFIRVEEPPLPIVPYALIALMVLIVIVIGFLIIASQKKVTKKKEELEEERSE